MLDSSDSASYSENKERRQQQQQTASFRPGSWSSQREPTSALSLPRSTITDTVAPVVLEALLLGTDSPRDQGPPCLSIAARREKQFASTAATPRRGRRVLYSDSEEEDGEELVAGTAVTIARPSDARETAKNHSALAAGMSAKGVTKKLARSHYHQSIASDSSDEEELEVERNTAVQVDATAAMSKEARYGSPQAPVSVIAQRRSRFLLNSEEDESTSSVSNDGCSSGLEAANAGSGDSLDEFIVSDGEEESGGAQSSSGEDGIMCWSPGCNPGNCVPYSAGQGRVLPPVMQPSSPLHREPLRKKNDEQLSTPSPQKWQWKSPQHSVASTPVAKATPRGRRPSAPALNQRQFTAQRQQLAEELYQKYNKRAFESRLPEQMGITWSKTLNTTAGRTLLIRKGAKFTAEIELSTKVPVAGLSTARKDMYLPPDFVSTSTCLRLPCPGAALYCINERLAICILTRTFLILCIGCRHEGEAAKHIVSRNVPRGGLAGEPRVQAAAWQDIQSMGGQGNACLP